MTEGRLAFLPVRGGSKSIKGKNIKQIAGRPLLHWAIRAADECEKVSEIVVSTDSEDIAHVAQSYGSSKISIHARSSQSATDAASTEQVLLEYARQHEIPETVILMQATSPLITADDLTRGISLFEAKEHDSVLSVVRQRRFIWSLRDGQGVPMNYDFSARPRRQDFDGYLVENGAFYITSREALLESQCRVSGRIGLVEMDEASYYEIDEPADWTVVNALLMARMAGEADALPDLTRIKAMFTDCDGVLTDGGMYYTETGDELKKFQTRDGVGLSLLRREGIVVGIITAESTELVSRRAAKLELDEVHMGVEDKLRVIDALCEKHGLSRDEVAYIGDDIGDVSAIEAVGFGCSVHDGMRMAKDAAVYITEAAGGQGAVREVAELIIGSRMRGPSSGRHDAAR